MLAKLFAFEKKSKNHKQVKIDQHRVFVYNHISKILKRNKQVYKQLDSF